MKLIIVIFSLLTLSVSAGAQSNDVPELESFDEILKRELQIQQKKLLTNTEFNFDNFDKVIKELYAEELKLNNEIKRLNSLRDSYYSNLNRSLWGTQISFKTLSNIIHDQAVATGNYCMVTMSKNSKGLIISVIKGELVQSFQFSDRSDNEILAAIQADGGLIIEAEIYEKNNKFELSGSFQLDKYGKLKKIGRGYLYKNRELLAHIIKDHDTNECGLFRSESEY